MRILLDTNALLWQLGLSDSGEIGAQAKHMMYDGEIVYVSSISLVEMHIKTMLGRLNAPADLAKGVENAGNKMLEFSGAAADAIRDFPNLARHDPFDRMLLAQAATEGLTFMTGDKILLDLGLAYVIDARK